MANSPNRYIFAEGAGNWKNCGSDMAFHLVCGYPLAIVVNALPTIRVIALLLMVVSLLSCSRTTVPAKRLIDCDAAAAHAMELFDDNSDGALDDNELKKSPGLAEGKPRVDSNGDGKISAEELAARFKYWNESSVRLVCTDLEITFNRRLVSDANITFEPEPFLADWLEEVQASTNQMGQCTPYISRELPGINMGYYRVKVSKIFKGKERIPANFNEQTELGVEFCDDRPMEENLLIQLRLETRKRRR
jgi:EF hand domain-containing protein